MKLGAMRRLVEVNRETGYALEVDGVWLAREGRELMEFILAMPSGDLKAEFTRKILPFCKGAIERAIEFPISPRRKPISITREFDDCGRELPAGFEELYARFFNTATGARVDLDSKISKDGKLWALMDFE